MLWDYNPILHGRSRPRAPSRGHRRARPAHREHRQSRCSRSGAAARPICACPAPTSRACTPRSASRTARCVIRDKQSRFGTFVNGVKRHRPRRRSRTAIRSASGRPATPRSSSSSTTKRRRWRRARSRRRPSCGRWRRCSRGCARLGSGRVLDDVLAMVLDSAIEVTGAERGFIMLANREKHARVQAGARPRQGRRCSGTHVRDQPQDSGDRVRHRPADDRRGSARRRSRASCTPARWRSASVTCSARRCAWCATSSARSRRGADEIIGVLYLDSRERGALTLGARAVGARDAVGRGGAGDRERAALPRGARQGEVRAGAEGRRGDSAVAAAGGEPRGRVLLDRGRVDRLPRGRRRLLRLRRSPDRPASASSSATWPGKGSPAALLAAAVLGMFSAEATYQVGAAPLMTRLNHGLFRRAIEARFLTSFYGILGADGSLTYSNAGHNAPLLVAASGIRRLETGGVVLGLFEHATLRGGNHHARAGRSHRRVQRRRHRGDEPGQRRVHRRPAARLRQQASRRDAPAGASTPCSPTSTSSAPAPRRATTSPS